MTKQYQTLHETAFDQWCNEMKIKKNTREALYHHLAANGELSNQDKWEPAFKQVANEIIANLLKK